MENFIFCAVFLKEVTTPNKPKPARTNRNKPEQPGTTQNNPQHQLQTGGTSSAVQCGNLSTWADNAKMQTDGDCDFDQSDYLITRKYKIQTNSNILNLIMILFTFFCFGLKIPFWGKFSSKYQHCLFEMKLSNQTNLNMLREMFICCKNIKHRISK